jgi:hypothetical protein
MTVTLTRLYDDYYAALAMVHDLQKANIPAADISIVANNSEDWYDERTRRPRVDRDGDGVDDRAEGAGAGAGIGGALGAGAGLLAGLGILAIPGLGPVVAAGWLASTAAVAAAGAATGGIIGALSQMGVSEEDAHVYAEGVRRGGALVTVRVNEGQRETAEAILDKTGVDIREREAAYKSTGWGEFDTNRPVYSAEEARAERESYRR